MEFIEKSRKLTSSTGFIKNIETGEIYDYSIYLGKFDSPENYTECSEADYQELLTQRAEEERKIQEEIEARNKELEAEYAEELIEEPSIE